MNVGPMVVYIPVAHPAHDRRSSSRSSSPPPDLAKPRSTLVLHDDIDVTYGSAGHPT